MTRYLLATLLCALFGVGAAHAQPAPSGLTGAYWAGAGCNAVTFSGPNGPYTLMVDSHGNLCVNATVSASVAVAPLTSSNLSGTVSVTNTFQSIQVLTAGRNGCSIQNNGTNSMWVFFGPIGSATKAHSFLLPASTSTSSFVVGCAVGGLGVLTDQVSITGTSGDAFVANFQ